MFNTVKSIDGIAQWYHAGPHGMVVFPYEWLDEKPTDFYGSPAYTYGIEMAYLLKNNVKLISPMWQLRDKDRADIAVLESILLARDINKEDIKKKVWSYNPYWYAKGYDEYFLPMTLEK